MVIKFRDRNKENWGSSMVPILCVCMISSYYVMAFSISFFLAKSYICHIYVPHLLYPFIF